MAIEKWVENLPALQGNWVDLVILVFVLYSGFEGLRRGFGKETLSLLGFLFSFGTALKFYSLGGQLLVRNFSLQRGMANAAGFLLMGVLGELVFSGLVSFLVGLGERKLKGKMDRKLRTAAWPELAVSGRRWLTMTDKVLGILPAVGNGLILLAFFLTLAVALPIKGEIKAEILSSKLGGPLVKRTQGVEQELAKVFGQALEESLTFLTIKPESLETIDLRFRQRELTVDAVSERRMFELINQERRDRGFKELSFERGKITEVARSHAKDMFEKGYFSHVNKEGEDPFDRLRKAGVSFVVAGENLALAPNVALAHQGLIASEGHRENILRPEFGLVGMGVIDGGIYGKMFVQLFTD